jgi:hypothetical protein
MDEIQILKNTINTLMEENFRLKNCIRDLVGLPQVVGGPITEADVEEFLKGD